MVAAPSCAATSNGSGCRCAPGTATGRVITGPDGAVAGVELTDGTVLDADVVVFAAGVRPRDELARAAGLAVGERGGVLVDEACRTSDEAIFAIGECAAAGGRVYGLVAPGYAMAEVAADRLAGGEATFTTADTSTKLKLLGVDVASFGDAFAQTADALELVFSDSVEGVYKKLVVTDDGKRLLGGMLVGDASAYAALRPLVGSGLPLPDDPAALILPSGQPAGHGAPLPDAGPRVQLQQRHGGLHPRLGAYAGMRDRRRGQDLHEGGAPAAAAASRWSSRSSTPSCRRRA